MLKDLIKNDDFESVCDILDIDYTNSYIENKYVFNAVKMALESNKRVYLSYSKYIKYYVKNQNDKLNKLNVIKLKRTLLDYILNTCSIVEL